MTPFSVVIPARYASSRLPGKPLMDIAGKAMLLRVIEQSRKAGAAAVWVATDDERIEQTVRSWGAEVMMTSPHHGSGTERLAEVVDKLALADDSIVVNVQGDEPLIPPANIRQVAQLLAEESAPMATLAVEIDDPASLLDANVVKVVCDKAGFALYFSRSPIPYDRQGFARSGKAPMADGYLRHVGIYAYRAGFIRRYVSWPQSPLERLESLEQLRVLWQGEKIRVAVAHQAPPHGVDTPADLARIRQLLQS